jgi:hypothetical protein
MQTGVGSNFNMYSTGLQNVFKMGFKEMSEKVCNVVNSGNTFKL